MKNRLLSIVLALALAFSVFAGGAVSVSAASGVPSDMYVRQDGSGYCTLASAVMMMRSKAWLEGASDWSNITQQTLKGTAWITGQGLRHSFAYYGIAVGYKEFSAEDKKAGLLDLLDRHPEGVEIYVRSLPHAVLLTRYDEEGDTFYVADPGLSTAEMTLADSWLRKISADSTQDSIIEAIQSYWYISSYKAMALPEPVVEVVTPAEETPSDAGTTPAPDPVTVTPPAAPAAEAPADTGSSSSSVVKFDRIKDFDGINFPDIDYTEWYIDYIEAAYEMGLMSGYDDGNFYVNGNVTIAQAITMAARIYSTYTGDGYVFKAKADEEWYVPYVNYAYKKGVITSKYYNCNSFENTAYRIQFAEIMSGALPEKALKAINEYADGDIKDVDSSEVRGAAVYQLYRAGVLTGDPDVGFNPYGAITRAQVAALVSRMADESMRVVVQ